jgi:hypothetical protein
MAGNEISIESAELALVSEIGSSSATLMKNAYLPRPGGNTDREPRGSRSHPGDSPRDEGPAGPGALVTVTKLSGRTPGDVIERLMRDDPDRRNTGSHDFYTVVLMIRMCLGDPSTTRFVTGTVDVVFPPGTRILDYAPKDKSTILSVIEDNGEAVSLSPDLVFRAVAAQDRKITAGPGETRFGIAAGPEEKITGMYSRKTGYTLDIPARFLLEYQGMLKNEHAIFWEMYPPMPPADSEITGNGMTAVFSLIVQAPVRSPPGIEVYADGRVKGDLWGMIPVRGSVLFPAREKPA